MKDTASEEEEMQMTVGLRRTQSLMSVSADTALFWRDEDKRMSVSQLVAQYQNSSIRNETPPSDIKHKLEISSSPVIEKDRHETAVRKKEKSRTSPLSRSKSLSILPASRPTGTSALRELFESKVTGQPKVISIRATRGPAGSLEAPCTHKNKDAKSQVVSKDHDNRKKAEEEERSKTSEKTHSKVSRTEFPVSGEEGKSRSDVDFKLGSDFSGLSEKPTISVKALSALYLSKVAAAEPAGNLLKPEQSPSNTTSQRGKSNKMSEGPENIPEHTVGNQQPQSNSSTANENEPQMISPPLLREAMSHQQQRRQKCELRRLLKHTYPELKSVESLLEKELAEIIDLDTEYQSEVQSRCWLFENQDIHSGEALDQKQQEDIQQGNIKKTIFLFDQSASGSCSEDYKPDVKPSEEEPEEIVTVDVKATRRLFENQSAETSRTIQSSSKKNIEDNQHQQKAKDNSVCRSVLIEDTKYLDFPQDNTSTDLNLVDTTEIFVGISKAKQIFETMAQEKMSISTNEREEELLKAKVKNRAQMFESTPLDKINQQTEVEFDVTTLETLVSVGVNISDEAVQHNENEKCELPRKPENISGNLTNAEELFAGNVTGDLKDELPVEILIKNQDITEDSNHPKAETISDMDVYEDGKAETVIHETESVGLVEDDALENLQTAITNLHQATIEAKALQESVQENNVPQTKQIPSPEEANNSLNPQGRAAEEFCQSSEPERENELEEASLKNSVQDALNSLGKSNFNVTRGDFKAAMIYRNSSKRHVKWTTMMDVDQPERRTQEVQPMSESAQAVEDALKNPTDKASKQLHENQETHSTHKTPRGPKPAVPPKPDHLKIKSYPRAEDENPLRESMELSPQKSNQDDNDSPPIDTLSSMKNMSNDGRHVEDTIKFLSETPRSHREVPIEFHCSLQNFKVKTSGSVPPVKPKRIKMAKDQGVIAENIGADSNGVKCPNVLNSNGNSSGDTSKPSIQPCEANSVSAVVRREKKVKRETEDERRQRLSVHMDEIMKGNVTTVMEIFDKMKQQEELKNILSKVEEIEEDSNEVDASSLKSILKTVPDWAVSREKKPGPQTLKSLGGSSEDEMKSFMQVAFGDLEKAGAEINRLKDQTLSKLMDIEEAIKKALYSVSTLKSESDIVGLSGLFRESMVGVQDLPSSGNIRKISIGSSRSPKANLNGPNKGDQDQLVQLNSKSNLLTPPTKPKSASPSFISIQSAARKPSELPSPLQKGDKQSCCQPGRNRRTSSSPPERQVSVLEVRRTAEGERLTGTKTVSENFQRTDQYGNKFFSSKTSTVVTTQAEPSTISKDLSTSRSATSEFLTYPRINTPVIREDRPPL